MTVVDESLVAETPAASAIGGVFGDGSVWFLAEENRGFDPVTDVAFGDVGEIGVEWIDAAVEHCAQGLSMLERLDPSGFDAATTMVGHRRRTTPPSSCRSSDRGGGSSTRPNHSSISGSSLRRTG
jgi:hypothetical protein